MYSILLYSFLLFSNEIEPTDSTADSSDGIQPLSSSQSGVGTEQSSVGFVIPVKRAEGTAARPILSTSVP
jgi:hypothetical protein